MSDTLLNFPSLNTLTLGFSYLPLASGEYHHQALILRMVFVCFISLNYPPSVFQQVLLVPSRKYTSNLSAFFYTSSIIILILSLDCFLNSYPVDSIRNNYFCGHLSLSYHLIIFPFECCLQNLLGLC